MKTQIRIACGLSAVFLVACSVAGAATLSIDVSAGAPTEGGFQSLSETDADLGDSWSKNFGGIGVDIDGVNVALDSRDRDNSLPDLFEDFVFALNADADTDGLDIAITGLNPNTQYPITIWSFDTGSGGNRVSDWSANDGGGGFLLKVDDYIFNGSDPDPTDLTTNRMDFSILTDGGGAITIQGRSENGTGQPHNIFVNGIEVGEPVPEPSSILLAACGLIGLLLLRRTG